MLRYFTVAGMLILTLLTSFNLSAQFKTASIEIDGLTCSMCSYGVQRSIQKLNFVNKVNVDLNTNVTSIEFKPNTTVNIRNLIKSVVDAGFSVRTLTAIFDSDKLNHREGAYFLFENSTFFLLNSTSGLTSKGLLSLKFVEKNFSDSKDYKKYKTVIDKALADTTLKDSYYFVTL